MTPVPGTSRSEQAIRLAGALAELSITELVFSSDSPSLREGVGGREHSAPSATGNAAILHSRLTDLPGMLTSAPIGTQLRAKALDLTIEVQPTGLTWSSANPAHAETFAAALNNP